MEDPLDLISIYRAADPAEAHLVMNLLMDEDIEAQVAEEHQPLPGLVFSASEVLVKRADEARARSLVDAYDHEQQERANRPDWTCPACGATVVGSFDECDACGADRPGSAEAAE